MGGAGSKTTAWAPRAECPARFRLMMSTHRADDDARRNDMTQLATAPPISDATGRFLALNHTLLIGDERVAADDGRRLTAYDPSTARAIATFAHAGASDVDR